LKYKLYILSLLTISFMVLIYYFSSQVSNVSSSLSKGLLNDIIGFIFYKLTPEKQWLIHHIFRKIAHFVLYAVLGTLLYFSIREFFINKKISNFTGGFTCISYNSIIFYASIISLLYAISDEVHQLFVPGRGCLISDVIIDSLGSLLGILLSYYLSRKSLICKSNRQSNL